MVTTRGSTKRAASPEVDVKVEPKKRGREAAAQPVDSHDDDEDPPSAQPPATKKKAKDEQPPKKTKDDEPAFEENAKYENGKGQLADGQYAKATNLIIPVDEVCPLASSYQIYVDDDNIIWDANLNQTDSGNNNNKFYRIQLLTDAKGKKFYTWTRWGRVGERGQSSQLGDGSLEAALREFQKKFKDKSGLAWSDRGNAPKSKKYVFLERSYEPDSDDEDEKMEDADEAEGSANREAGRARSTSPVKCTLAPPVKSLVELIFNQQYIDSTMADMNYDAKKMPLGKLSKPTITRGYQALKDLSALLDDDVLDHSGIEELSNRYYSYIPHEFGRNRPPVINTHERLKREVTLLESLTDLKDADAILKSDKQSTVHPLDSRFNNLRLHETTPIEHDTAEFTNINDYLVNSNVHGINYNLLDVFRIERQGEHDRFEKSFGKVASDRRLLWHGSRVTNYGGILSQGLRIAPPEAPVSGYMFGKGVYLADASSKSSKYCASGTSGGHALLLLCEAELGKPMQTLTNASYSAGDDALAKGLHSTWGQGSTGPAGWKDAKCVHPSLEGVNMPDTSKKLGPTNVPGAYLQYNEYICYDVAQIRLRYLLRVKM